MCNLEMKANSPPKLWYLFVKLHVVIHMKTELFVKTAVILDVSCVIHTIKFEQSI
jgi:hypothetical protein